MTSPQIVAIFSAPRPPCRRFGDPRASATIQCAQAFPFADWTFSARHIARSEPSPRREWHRAMLGSEALVLRRARCFHTFHRHWHVLHDHGRAPRVPAPYRLLGPGSRRRHWPRRLRLSRWGRPSHGYPEAEFITSTQKEVCSSEGDDSERIFRRGYCPGECVHPAGNSRAVACLYRHRGAGFPRRPLPHHRTGGSASGGSES